MFNNLADVLTKKDLQFRLGTVESVNDPKNQGRVQVKIPGILDEGDLPWYGVNKSSVFGIGPSFGTYGSPAKGSNVLVLFQDNDIHHGLILGSVITSTTGTSGFGNGDWGFKDPQGNIFKVSQGTVTFTTASGVSFSTDSSGALKINATQIFLNSPQ